jgi:hypothetical protein
MSDVSGTCECKGALEKIHLQSTLVRTLCRCFMLTKCSMVMLAKQLLLHAATTASILTFSIIYGGGGGGGGGCKAADLKNTNQVSVPLEFHISINPCFYGPTPKLAKQEREAPSKQNCPRKEI